MNVAIDDGANAMVYCGAFQVLPQESADDVYPRSVYEVKQQRLSVATSGGTASLTIRGLSAASSYKVYCLTESFKGVVMEIDQMLSTWATGNTACCKTVSVSQSVTALFEQEGAATALTVTLDAVPFLDMSLSVSAVAVVERSDSAASRLAKLDDGGNFFPASVHITNTSSTKSFSFSFSAGTLPDVYSIVVSLAGASAGEYAVSFAGGASGLISVLAVHQEPPTPVLSSATFSNDGSSVEVQFNAPTNQGGFVNAFPCPAVLQFSGSASAVCRWGSPTSISITSADSLLSVGSSLSTIEGSTVRAQCTRSDASDCVDWATVAPITVSIDAPEDPELPVVSFSMPSTISSCTNLSIDLSTSSGSGGRDWLAPTFSVISDEDTGAVEQLLNSEHFTMVPPTEVPNRMFTPGATYTFTATLCNFLGACGTGSRAVLVSPSDDLIPVVVVVGSAQRSIVTSVTLILTSDAYTVDCRGSIVRSGLVYDWAVFDDGELLPSISSQSQDPAKFRLPAYTLTPLHNYVVRLTVRNSVSSQSETAAVNIFVAQSALVAQLRGGSTQSVAIGSSVLIDASTSFDPDFQSATGSAAGLQFSWSCVQVRPAFRTTCALDADIALDNVGKDTELVSFTANIRAVNTTSSVTVTVFDGTRSSSVSVEIKTQDSSAPLVDIVTSTQAVSAIDVNKQLRLSGTVSVQSPCTAAWKVDDSSLSISEGALSPLSMVVPIASTRTMNLVLAAQTLPERATLGFSLTCGPSSASIVVTTNGPPLPGTFSVSPSEGVELVTNFLLSATSWTDKHLPITYQFGFVSGSTGARLALQSRSEAPFGSSALAAGPAELDGAVSCYADVFDSLGAFIRQTRTVKVTAAMVRAGQNEEEGIDEVLIAQLRGSSGNADSTMSTLSIGSSMLNAVNCSLAPNCAELNRARCAAVPHTCGACMVGYIGDDGDSNELCVDAVADSARRLWPREPQVMSSQAGGSLAVPCTSNSDCARWEQCSSALQVCTLPQKQCANDCSGHGACIKINLNTLNEVGSCAINDPSCVPRCRCVGNYTGYICDDTVQRQLQQQQVRHEMLSGLSELTSFDDINDESIAAWTSSLSSLAQNPFEISANDIYLIQEVALKILDSASSLPGLSYDAVSQLLSVVDSLGRSAQDHDSGSSSSSSTQLLTTIAMQNAELVAAFSDLVRSGMIGGQNAVEFVQRNFRTSTTVQYLADVAEGGGMEVTLPRTGMEIASRSSVSTVRIAPSLQSSSTSTSSQTDAAVAVMVLSTTAAAFGAAADSFSANPMKIELTSSLPTSASESSLASQVTIVLAHNHAVNFSANGTAPQSLLYYMRTAHLAPLCTTTRALNSGKVITHRCSGSTKGTMTSYCPILGTFLCLNRSFYWTYQEQ